MTDDDRSDDEQALMHLLSDPSVWGDTSDVSEDAIVAAISAEAGTIAEPASGLSGLVESSSSNGDVVPISSARRWVAPFAAGIAAALLIVVGLAAAFRFGDDSSGIELTLAGTELAPEATATASFDDTPIGTRIILDVSGLPPLPRALTTRPGCESMARRASAPEPSTSAVAMERSSCGQRCHSTTTRCSR